MLARTLIYEGQLKNFLYVLTMCYFNISHIMYICLFYGEQVLNRNAVTTYANKGILYTRPESNKKLGVCDHFNKSTVCNLPTN